MTDQTAPARRLPVPLFELLLAFIFPLSLGALLSDWAYSRSYEVQWVNFADWLVAGSLVGGGFALLWALVETTMGRAWGNRSLALGVFLLLAFWILQFINALTHARDAFATMPTALILSVITTLLALAASWLLFSQRSQGEVR